MADQKAVQVKDRKRKQKRGGGGGKHYTSERQKTEGYSNNTQQGALSLI